MKITLGCDPEMFLESITGELRSSIGLIGGTKHAPQPLPLGDGYAVQEDNVAVEFNIPPASSSREFVESIQKTIGFIGKVVDGAYGFRLSHRSAASFPASELENPMALEFGCEPDFNAWTGEQNPRPETVDKSLRSCGGHIHIGFDQTKTDARTIIRMCDLYLGVGSVLMDKGHLRKNLYGKAGAHRTKPFGVEYRTLSNFWIFEEKLINWAWKNTERAVNAAVAQQAISLEDEACIINAINKNDIKLAEQMVNKFQLEVI